MLFSAASANNRCPNVTYSRQHRLSCPSVIWQISWIYKSRPKAGRVTPFRIQQSRWTDEEMSGEIKRNRAIKEWSIHSRDKPTRPSQLTTLPFYFFGPVIAKDNGPSQKSARKKLNTVSALKLEEINAGTLRRVLKEIVASYERLG